MDMIYSIIPSSQILLIETPFQKLINIIVMSLRKKYHSYLCVLGTLTSPASSNSRRRSAKRVGLSMLGSPPICSGTPFFSKRITESGLRLNENQRPDACSIISWASLVGLVLAMIPIICQGSLSCNWII